MDGGWGELDANWDVYSYKHGGMFMGCGQLEYKLIKLSLFGFPNTVLPEVLCLILGKPEQTLKPYSTFNNFPPGIFPASFHHKPVHGFYKNCYMTGWKPQTMNGWIFRCYVSFQEVKLFILFFWGEGEWTLSNLRRICFKRVGSTTN